MNLQTQSKTLIARQRWINQHLELTRRKSCRKEIHQAKAGVRPGLPPKTKFYFESWSPNYVFSPSSGEKPRPNTLCALEITTNAFGSAFDVIAFKWLISVTVNAHIKTERFWPVYMPLPDKAVTPRPSSLMISLETISASSVIMIARYCRR